MIPTTAYYLGNVRFTMNVGYRNCDYMRTETVDNRVHCKTFVTQSIRRGRFHV